MATSAAEDRLVDLLVRWDELRRHGRDATADELCADSPELVGELRGRIQALRGIDPVLEIVQTTIYSTLRDPGVEPPAVSELPELMTALAVYRPQRHHARGGLGEVLAARQEELGRLVALKRIRPERLHDAARRRFLREAEITAGLQHPGIVPIYAVGQDEHGPFYTMPLVQGQTFEEAIEEFHRDESLSHDSGEGSLRLRNLLQKFVNVCDTVAYAHDQGIIHRDLKPSNIMLGRYGETLVMDWGLAKRIDTEASDDEHPIEAPSQSSSPDALTATGAVLGTPRYMSPEQAKGETTGRASDVFNLGLVLYAILTGKSAFDEARFPDLDSLRAVRETAIVPPRQRDPSVPAALEAVCMKALSNRPEDRYDTPRALAGDLERWLADEPVSAWPEPATARARRFLRRYRAWMLPSAVALIAVSLGLAASLAAEGARNIALEKARRRADANASFLLQGLTEALKRLANPALSRDPECRASALAALREGEAIYFDVMDSERRFESAPSRMSGFWIHVALLRTAAGDREGTLEAYRRAIDEAMIEVRRHPYNPKGWGDVAGVRTHLGLDLWVRGMRSEARDQLRRATEEFRRALDLDPDDEDTQRTAAWLHIFCPDTEIRNARLALELSERFARKLSLEGKDRPRFNAGIRPLFTLALAQYRTGDWQAARLTIEESIRKKASQQGAITLERLVETRVVIDAYDWFVWSMALARLGATGSARQHFEDATQWMRQNRNGDFELQLLHDEAGSLLGLFTADLSSDRETAMKGSERTGSIRQWILP